MDTIRFNVFLPVFISIFLALYFLKVMPHLANSISLYNDAPEYAKLDKKIGTFNLPQELTCSILVVIAFLGVLVWRDIVLYKNISALELNSKVNCRILCETAFCGSLGIQMGFAYIGLSAVYKFMGKGKSFLFLSITGFIVGLAGIVCTCIFLNQWHMLNY